MEDNVQRYFLEWRKFCLVCWIIFGMQTTYTSYNRSILVCIVQITGYAVSSGITLLNMLFKDLIDTGVFQDKKPFHAECVRFWFNLYSKEEGEDQESIQCNTTPDLGRHIGNWQEHKKTTHTREPFPSRWPHGYIEETTQYDNTIWQTRNINNHEISTTLERSVK